jgi:Flp pilus assembly protein TadB
MKRPARLLALTLTLLACVLLLALSAWLHSWGGVTLVVLGAAGVGWYRMQVARSEAAEQFFTDLGEDTRVTGLQPGSPSELPHEPGTRPR